MSKKEAMGKRGRLSLKELADYDDILTDALVDHVYFWTHIRKNRSKYNLTRGISQDDVCRILLNEVICSKDTQTAERFLLKLPGLLKFLNRLQTEREKEDFKKHMRKYINIWLPDCPFEVSTTNRYTIITHEAATIARREIKKGETIKYLCGNLVAITPEEEKDLDLTRRDFSIVMSSRKKTPSLFLGPARFANHDCNANARLVTVGSDGMQVVAVRSIARDEEITVTYGEDYFGIGNCECLCQSCELAARSGWTALESSADSAANSVPRAEDVNPGPYSLRNKRKFGDSGISSGSRTPDVDNRRVSRKRRKSAPIMEAKFSQNRGRGGRSKLKSKSLGSALKDEILSATVTELPKQGDTSMELLPMTQEAALDEDIAVEMPTFKEELPAEEPHNTQPFSTPPNICLKAVIGLATENRVRGIILPLLNPMESIEDPADEFLPVSISELSEDELCRDPDAPVRREVFVGFRKAAPTSQDTSLATPAMDRRLSSQHSQLSSEADSIFDQDLKRSSSPASVPSTGLIYDSIKHENIIDLAVALSRANPTPEPLSEGSIPDTISTLSEMAPSESFDDTTQTITRIPARKSRKLRIPAAASTAETAAPEMPQTRHPGDYLRHACLLGEPCSRWVECTTCAAAFVQPDGYFTRKECPRCERHSKLYGYQWPKTEREKGDSVERVMDHRTVHRFLTAREEARLRRQLRGEDVDLDDDDAQEPEEGQQGPGQRKKYQKYIY